jgi:hypothetical protein
MCTEVPTPAETNVSLPCWVLANSISSFVDLTFIDGLTTRTLLTLAKTMMGSTSLFGSCLSVSLYRAAAMPCRLLAVPSRV